MNKKKSFLAGLCKYALSLSIFALLFFSIDAWGAVQTIDKIEEVTVVGYGVHKSTRASASPVSKLKPLLTAEQMPQFSGGEEALMKLIVRTLNYPASAVEAGVQGKLIMRFVVSETGEITNIEVVKGLCTVCDEEGIRVIKQMPKWVPGKEKGKNVAVYYTLPISFKLQK